jgi:hypothetical protein
MKVARGSRAARRASHAGDAAARERVARLFEDVDRLTPDELGRIGLEAMDPAERHRLEIELAAAARRTGRSALVAEVRTAARDAVIRRFAAGGLNATWMALNWGVSQGTAASRAAIIEAIENAAAAAVVADALDAETLEALSLPGERVVAMATGRVSEGSLAAALAPPVGAEYRATPMRWLVALLAGGIVAVLVFTLVAAVAGMLAALIAFVVTLGLVLVFAVRPG